MSEKIRYAIFGIVGGAVLAGVVVYAGFMFSSGGSGGQQALYPAVSGATSTQPGGPALDCTVKTVTAIVRGNSMEGILKDGQEVPVLQNYYACNKVERGDIVVYNFPSSPIVKKVMGLPGDTFAIKASGSGWNIVVNGKPLVTSDGTSYLLPDATSKMLALYATSDKGVIPPDGYMILGNVPTGSQDSTSFGLVSKTDFIGKVKI